MNHRDQDALLLLLVVGYLYGQAVPRARAASKTVQKFGAKIYDAVHNERNTDLNHSDLPGPQLTREAVLAIAKNAGFPDPKLAAAIAMAESGGVTNALNRSSREVSVGLWQINTKVHPYSASDMRNPLKNARAAFQISKGGTNWQPWAAFTSGRYQQYRTGILQ